MRPNGISFYGVGNGTTVEYVQAYKVFGRRLRVLRRLGQRQAHGRDRLHGDDSFDWTEGWNGRGQFLVAYQSGEEECDCLMECDNNGNNFDATPVAHPILSNLTLVGDNSANNTRGNTSARRHAGRDLQLDHHRQGQVHHPRDRADRAGTAQRHVEAPAHSHEFGSQL